jgi:hypothetical protein
LGEVSNSWILNIGRNFMPGNRKRIAKCLMRTFTCRSTFLYGPNNIYLQQGSSGKLFRTESSKTSYWTAEMAVLKPSEKELESRYKSSLTDLLISREILPKKSEY